MTNCSVAVPVTVRSSFSTEYPRADRNGAIASLVSLKFRFDTVAFILQHHNLMCDGAVAVLATK